MKLLFFIITICLFGNISGQESQADSEDYLTNAYPEGIYLSYKSFLNKKPTNTKTVEARDVFKPKRQINDPLIDNCYFNYRRTGKRVKDAFAISYKGSLYFHIKSVQKMMDKKDSRQKMEHRDSFLRVMDQGTFLYMEGYVKKGGGIGIGIGSGPISVGTGGPREELRGIVFDIDRELFDLFRDCKDFNSFLESARPDRAFKCPKKSVPIAIVRDVMFKINVGL